MKLVGLGARPQATLETHSLGATGLVCSFSFLTDCYLRQPGPPCSLNPGDFCQLGPSVFPVCGVGAGSPQPWAQQASCCPSGLQHNRIWEVRADTFRELTFLQSL